MRTGNLDIIWVLVLREARNIQKKGNIKKRVITIKPQKIRITFGFIL